MRATDAVVHELRSSSAPRADLIGRHMGRLILHLVFQDPDVRPRYPGNCSLDELVSVAKKAVEPIFTKVAAYLAREHGEVYPANLSKNAEKCETLVKEYALPPSSPPGQQPLFK